MSFRMRKPYEKVDKLTSQPRNNKPTYTADKDVRIVVKPVQNNQQPTQEVFDQFNVGDDTIIFDSETGLWKIKK